MLMRVIFFLLLITIFIPACGSGQSSSTHVLTSSPTTANIQPSVTTSSPTTANIQPSVTTSSPTTANIQPSVTTKPTVEKTATLFLQCPPIVLDVSLENPEIDEEIKERVLTYLNAGGTPKNLLNIFHENGYENSVDILATDLDGDNLEEVLISIARREFQYQSHTGKLYVYKCSNSDYKLITSFDLYYKKTTKIIGIDNMFPSSFPQVIVETRADRTWAKNFFIVGWDGADWQLFFKGGIGEMGISADIVIFDKDGDGVKEISLFGSTSVTSGGGLPRSILVSYKWNGSKYIRESEELLPSSYRIHFLQDAQLSLEDGDISRAIAFYKIAASDPNLSDWPSHYEFLTNQVDQAGIYQISFAQFREAALWLGLGREENADEIIERMNNDYYQGTPGSEFVEAIIIFKSQLENGETLESACQTVSSFFMANFPDIGGVGGHIGYWGIMNVLYDVVDLCPFN